MVKPIKSYKTYQDDDLYFKNQEKNVLKCRSLTYSSREMLRGKNLNKSADMWTLLVLAYEPCFDETLWQDVRLDEIKQMIYQGNNNFLYYVPEEVQDFIKNYYS